ncbi:MAG: hypothetical protein M3450_00990 [Actinomycetota bacterium]|nr:hypothetical protein [Actinomycetota bacterium]
MESNDYWTHVGLVTAFFVAVVGPRLFSPGHEANSVTYVVGAAVVIVVATFARYRTKAASASDRIASRSVEDVKP